MRTRNRSTPDNGQRQAETDFGVGRPGSALAALVLLAALSGCAAPSSRPADLRVFVTPDAGVFADLPIVVPGPLMQASVRLVNPTGVDRPVIDTTDWVDAAGLPVRSPASAPQRLTVPRYGDATLQVIAPNPAAIQLRIRVEPDSSAS